jgi:hypothetical protein
MSKISSKWARRCSIARTGEATLSRRIWKGRSGTTGFPFGSFKPRIATM